MLILLCLIACAHPPTLVPVPRDAPVKNVTATVPFWEAPTTKVVSEVRYARKGRGPFSRRAGGPDTLATVWTAPASQRGSALTGWDVRTRMAAVLDANSPVVASVSFGPNIFTIRWVIVGVSPGQTVQLQHCVNARNAAGPSTELCGNVVAYTALDQVPLPPGSVTSIVVKLP